MCLMKDNDRAFEGPILRVSKYDFHSSYHRHNALLIIQNVLNFTLVTDLWIVSGIWSQSFMPLSRGLFRYRSRFLFWCLNFTFFLLRR